MLGAFERVKLTDVVSALRFCSRAPRSFAVRGHWDLGGWAREGRSAAGAASLDRPIAP